MQGLKFKLRIAFLVAIIACCVTAFASTLWNMQVIEGEEYLDTSQNNITQSVTVAASRGDILDRYDRVLVTNRVCYNVVVSRSTLLRQAAPNYILLQLMDICDAYGVKYADALPITVSGSAVTYAKDATQTQMNRLKALLEARGIDPERNANEVYTALVKRYKVPEEFTPAQCRAIVGVRYELELRTVLNMTGYIFASDVDTDFIAMLNEFNLPSVNVVTGSVRVYNTDYAAHILGRTGPMSPEEYEVYKGEGYPMDAIIGKDGIERAFEDYLHGENGTETLQTNLEGRVTGTVTKKDPKPGQNVVLTIDIGLQAASENALKNAILALRTTEKGADAEGGAAVVLQVGTGDVLASASYPTYSLETFSRDFEALRDDTLKPMLNRALMGAYEPGSTFKMATAIAAMETDVISSSTVIRDEGVYKYYAYANYQPVCWIYAQHRLTHGDQNVIQAIQNSCNYFFYETGRLTGITAISSYAGRLGLGAPTGTELPEETGRVASIENREAAGGVWQPGDTLQAAIGQSDNSFTPIQLANYIATIATGGVRYEAHFLDKVLSPDYTQVVDEYEPVAADDLGLKDDTIYSVRQGMKLVASSGTAAETFMDFGVQVAAKTGSAQTGGSAANAVFVCYAPFDNPEIAIAVVVEKGAAGADIAYIARDILEYYFANRDTLPQAGSENALIK